MSLMLIVLFAFCGFTCLRCEIQESPGLLLNSIDENGQASESTEKISPNDFRLAELISSINIDYANNALVLHFRKNENPDVRTKLLLDKNFMRFGRGDSALMRFGKRQVEFLEADPEYQSKMSEKGGRDSRGDNFMRFGRSSGGLPVKSKSSSGEERKTSDDQNRSLFRFGRANDNSMMRFGRNDRDFMRFGRNNGMMRFGRSDSFMRLGRTPFEERLSDDAYDSRHGRNDKNFMRFGKLDQNFMRFGKRDQQMEHDDNTIKSKTLKSNGDFPDNVWKPDGSTMLDSKLSNLVD